MRSAVTVSLVPEAMGGPFVYWAGLASAWKDAAALGYDGIEIFPPSADAIDAAEIAALQAEHPLRVAAVGTGAGWLVRKLTLTHPEVAVRRQAREFIRSIIEAAAAWEAPAIIGSMQGRVEGGVGREQGLAYLGEALEDLGEHARARGVPLLYEPLNRYETNVFSRLGDTAAWLQTLRTQNVRILADLFHMNMEEGNSAAALREAGSRVGHVHFADSNRRAIGFGQTDVAAIVAALHDMAYAGYLSAEVLPLPDTATAARQTIASFRRHAVPR